MCRWIESVAIKDGEIRNLVYHQQRVTTTLKHFKGETIDFDKSLSKLQLPKVGLHKIRIVYGLTSIVSIQITPYVPRSLSTFQIVDGGDIDYSYKYENREKLDTLRSTVEADEIIISRSGIISDTSFSNLIFYNGVDWVTPKEPLLRGTQRAYLLNTKIIKEAIISVKDIASFKCFKLINAMLSFDDSPIYEINQIRV